MSKYWKHLKLITIHKWYVFKACCRAGIVWRGIVHDLSKYSPTEFLESCKFFTGVRSPIDGAKEEQGYSLAWLHHKGRNPHHWEHWVDNLSSGGVGTLMSYEYAVEFLCDYVGAGQAYEKNKWNFNRPYEYWIKQNQSKIHPAIVEFITNVFWIMKEQKNYDVLKKHHTKTIYNACVREWKEESRRNV